MDFNKAKVPTIARLEIRQNKAPTGVFVTAYTPDSKEWRQASKVFAPKGQENLNMRVQKKGDSIVELPNDPNAHENRIKKLAAISISIEGFKDQGKPLVFTPQMILDFYSDDGAAWFIEDLEDQLDDRANFLDSAEKIVKSTSDA